MLYGQVAAQDLQKHAAELLRGDVVQQGVHHGAEVEEAVSYGKKSDVRSEVGDSPVLLWFRSSHDPSNLVWHPAYCQGCNNQPCEQTEKHRVTEYPELEGIPGSASPMPGSPKDHPKITCLRALSRREKCAYVGGWEQKGPSISSALTG